MLLSFAGIFFLSMGGSTTILLAAVYAITILSLIVAIAFFTVLERKVLAAIQRRRGPNMVGQWGLLQALADGLKLLMKEPLIVSGANYYIFLSAPIVLLTLSLTLWVFVPLPGFAYGVDNNYSFVVVFLFSALNTYAIILAGLSSNSRYSLIGGVRAIAQLISYEVPLSLSLLTLFCVQGSFNLSAFSVSRVLFFALALPSLVIFFISLLAETNRTPFDLPEAEAELVAGYNLEYSSILFSLFFLAEYSNILVAASLLSFLFFNSHFYISVIFFCLLIIAVRAILPRYTFVQMINLCWKTLFPLSLSLFFLTVIIIYLLNASLSSLYNVELYGALSHSVSVETQPWRAISAASGSALLTAWCIDSRAACCIATAWELFSATTPSANLILEGSTGAEYVGVSVSHKIVIFFLTAFAVVLLIVAVNWLLMRTRPNNRKNSPYECGFETLGSPVVNFSPNFATIGLIFLIYDVEVLLLFPWAYDIHSKGAFAICGLGMFIAIILLGYVYEVLDDTFRVV